MDGVHQLDFANRMFFHVCLDAEISLMLYNIICSVSRFGAQLPVLIISRLRLMFSLSQRSLSVILALPCV